VTLIEPGSIATPIWEKGRSEADRLQVPPELQEPYGAIPEKLDRLLHETGRRGSPPDAVAEAIEKALRTPRMPARVLIGNDARAMLTLKRLLPDRAFDRLVRGRLKL
jgi:NAD(P)-dependent dehydrogenase (short-subunit alcohol dehydrogenase family)